MRAAIADIFHKNFFIGFIYGTLAVERIHVAVNTGAGTQPRAGTKARKAAVRPARPLPITRMSYVLELI